MEGRPRNEDNNLFRAKKETRLELRKAIKNNEMERNIKENNTLMEANFRDPKLFSKLVNKNRVQNQGYTAMINVHGEEYRGDAQVLSGFFSYHILLLLFLKSHKATQHIFRGESLSIIKPVSHSVTHSLTL